MTKAKRLLTVREAAEYLSMSHHTLNCLRVSGGGPVFVKLGSAVRYEQADLDKFVNANKYKHTTQFGQTGPRSGSTMVTN